MSDPTTSAALHPDPDEVDLASPEFNAVWAAIKGWDIERESGAGYAGATGTDVMTVLNAIRGAGLKIVRRRSWGITDGT